MDKRKETPNKAIGHGAILEDNHKVFKPFSTLSSEYRESYIGDKGGYCSRTEMGSFIKAQQTDVE